MSSFNVEKPQQSSGFLLWQVTVMWQREIKTALETLGLSHSNFVILASMLWFEEHGIDVVQTTIINHTKLDKMSVSKSLRVLEAGGFVARSEHATDTRAKSIVLTPEGKTIAIKALKLVEEIDSRFFGKLTKEEQETLNELFERLQ